MHLFRGGISIVIKECISILLENENLTKEQATRCMTEIMTGEASPAQIGSFLVVLKKKGETVEEVTAFARVMREFSRRIHPRSRRPISGYVRDGRRQDQDVQCEHHERVRCRRSRDTRGQTRQSLLHK